MIVSPPELNLPEHFFASRLEEYKVDDGHELGSIYSVAYINHIIDMAPPVGEDGTVWYSGWPSSARSSEGFCGCCNTNVVLGRMYHFSKTMKICSNCFNVFFILVSDSGGNFPTVNFVKRIHGARLKRAIND